MSQADLLPQAHKTGHSLTTWKGKTIYLPFEYELVNDFEYK